MLNFRELTERFRREDEAERKKTACQNMAIGVAIGTVIGFAAGILLAPKSGKETCQSIVAKTNKSAQHMKEVASAYVGEIKSKLQGPIEEGLQEREDG